MRRAPDPGQADTLVERLHDRRSGEVIFLSHCLLNQNTRYLGGACRSCCVREVIEQCIDLDLGIVQMPCPEQEVWGGVLKKRMLALYGSAMRSPPRHWLLMRLAPAVITFTRLAYRRMAARVADQIEDYVKSGFSVRGIVGVDGSPSCGVQTTVGIAPAIAAISELNPQAVTVDKQNEMVRTLSGNGRGLFITELQEQLRRRKLDILFLAHDLLSELQGHQSNLRISEYMTSQAKEHPPTAWGQRKRQTS